MKRAAINLKVILLSFIILAFACFISEVKALTLINTCTELQDMSLNLTEDYELVTDIDCSATATWNAGLGYDPVGDNLTPFTGTFDGKGFTISDLTINRPLEDYVALFGYIDTASVEDITIENGSISGNTYVAAIAGYADDAVLLTELHNMNTIITTASGSAGGLFGEMRRSPLTFSTVDTTINSSAAFVGGIAGNAISGVTEITDSSSQGNIVITGSPGSIGGLVGFTNAMDITRSFSTVDITGGTPPNAGGLVGFVGSGTVIADSYSIATDIQGGSVVGGLVGRLNVGSTITNSYASTDNLTGTSELGGLIGRDNTGATGTTNSYWNVDFIANSADGTGLSSAQMKDVLNFMTWDFDTIWCLKSSLDSPVFISSPLCKDPETSTPEQIRRRIIRKSNIQRERIEKLDLNENNFIDFSDLIVNMSRLKKANTVEQQDLTINEFINVDFDGNNTFNANDETLIREGLAINSDFEYVSNLFDSIEANRRGEINFKVAKKFIRRFKRKRRKFKRLQKKGLTDSLPDSIISFDCNEDLILNRTDKICAVDFIREALQLNYPEKRVKRFLRKRKFRIVK